jgi:hypothetical protein
VERSVGHPTRVALSEKVMLASDNKDSEKKLRRADDNGVLFISNGVVLVGNCWAYSGRKSRRREGAKRAKVISKIESTHREFIFVGSG